jgi:hypothetical protein
MSARFRIAGLLAALAASTLGWQFGRAQQSPEPTTEKVPVTAELLGGADRYLTHVSTDKPIYRPGERVYVRGVLLHQFTGKPLGEVVEGAVEVLGPKGDVVASGRAGSEDGVLAFAWEIPAEQAGGQYTVKVSHPWTGDAPAERKFDIRAYRAPRLRSQIKFLRDGYGPGDEVMATLETTRAEGGVPANAKVTVVARVDDTEAFRGDAIVDATGHCLTRFKLPAEIARGEGTLAMVIEDGGVVETASKTIPILLQTVDLNIYPEGGDLVAGLSNRVYFEAFTPARMPADLAGIVVDSLGREVASIRSEHEGRGRFTFTPVAGDEYRLKITEPAGIRTTFPLPAVKPNGVVITSLGDVSTNRVGLRIASTIEQSMIVTLRKRERELDRKEVQLAGGKPTQVELDCGDATGVLVTTVWGHVGESLRSKIRRGEDSQQSASLRVAATWPLAERLVFAKPPHEVLVNISADRPRYVPGGKATLSLTTTDESGAPTSAVVGLTVTDDSVLEMIDRREQAPRLPVMALLEPDVRDLADAHVYLDRDNPQAATAIDLLLGTQGWRRFALIDVATFIEQHSDAARRVLALRIPTRVDRFGLGGWGGEDRRFWRMRAIDDKDFALPAMPQDALALSLRDGAAEPANDKKINEHLALGAVVNGFAVDQLAAVSANRPVELQQELPVRELEARRKLLAGALEQAPLAKLQRLDEAKHLSGGNDFIAVRVFAHAARPERRPGERTDFTETLFWHAGLKTDDAGKATIEFDLNDAVTSFRVFADAFNTGGALGSATTAIESVEPFYIEPKLPLEVTTGDVVLAPVNFVNSTGEPIEATLSIVSPFRVTGDVIGANIKLPPDSRVRRLVQIPIGESYGTLPIVHAAEAGEFADSVTRTLTVKPLGFPVERGRGGLIDRDGTVEHVFEIPETVVAGSLRTKAVVYPTPLASMTEALARLIQEPCGCFEQTSSTVYPLVMAQQYFLEHQGVDPMLIERSAATLESGYQRLVGFECKGGGYEWFGSDPGHDALTAYGLMEFTDMARVRHVDPAMLARTRKWFLAQRDGQGGFARKTHTLHTWLPDPEVANTYNTWALFEAGVDGDFGVEVNWVRNVAERTENTYVIALAANVLAAAGDANGAARLLDKLAGRQQKNGALSGATVSVVGSSGEALEIESTALAVLAWLRDEHYAEQVERGIQFLAECCKAGRFGSTQSTVLALRAITAYDRARAKPEAPGELQLVVDGEPIGDPISFTPDSQGALELPDFSRCLTSGRHRVEIQMTGGSKMPFSVATNYFATKPDSSTNCKLEFGVTLTDERVIEGELTEARLKIANASDETVPNPIAIVGIPGGLEVRHDQLKELVKSGRIAAFEVLGRDLVLYWRSFAANEQVELPISVVAAIPGTYTGPASRAYLYYTDEDKIWKDGLQIEITQRRASIP